MILTGVCLVFFSLAGLAMYAARPGGSHVTVWADGTQRGVYPLDREQEIAIETQSGTNILRIQDGSAKITQADCPDRLCVRQKEISKKGQSIICLPHKIVVEVTGEEKNDHSDLDAVVN